MNVGVIPNEKKDPGYAFTKEVCNYLTANGHKALLGPSDAFALGMPESATPDDMLYRDASFIVVLGGDGTMLYVSHRAAIYGTQLFGINLGTFGYLTSADKSDGLVELEKALGGLYRREKRMTLMVECDAAASMSPPDRIALNDVCLSRGEYGKLISFHLHINGNHIDSLKADGVIIATPTGSTAYSLSAGGPVIMPEGDMIAITPVCPHALYARPMVASSFDKVVLTAAEDTPNPIDVSLDGTVFFSLKKGEKITVGNSGCDAFILKTSEIGFFETLRRKMGV